MENLELYYKFEKGFSKIYEFLPVVSSYTSPKSLISIVGYNENKQNYRSLNKKKKKIPIILKINSSRFLALLSYSACFLNREKKTIPRKFLISSNKFFVNRFVLTDLCPDKTFGKTPACLTTRDELGHFFVKKHIFVNFSKFSQNSTKKPPCPGRSQS